MKKKYIIIFGVLLILFFSIFYYKIRLNGNNIIKQNQEDIIENILSDNFNYKAKIKVKIYSNKNENEYEIEQEEKEEYSYLNVVSKGDISGLTIEYNNKKLIVKNTKLNLDKIYENYKPITNNCLFLSSFSKEYKESTNVSQYEDEENLVIKFEIKNYNKYIKYKELYLNKESGMPKKMIIKNSDKQIVICIEYTNIDIM